jgi:hypothetical protein
LSLTAAIRKQKGKATIPLNEENYKIQITDKSQITIPKLQTYTQLSRTLKTL